MEHRIALLFPGQGAQSVGMGLDFYQEYEPARKIFEQAKDVLGSEFLRCVFEGPAEELTQTKNSQVAIYVVSMAIYETCKELFPKMIPYACAGLSLGEYSALAASGKISFVDGLKLVAKRAQLMQEACIANPGSMQVVLGMEEEKLLSAIASLQLPSLCLANINCPGQLVIAGTKEDLAIGAEALKNAGAKRVLPLDVSGAFHSSLMHSAQEGLAPFLRQVSLKDTSIGLVMNTPGDLVADLDQIRSYLIAQVTQPVRWQKGIECLVGQGITHFLELGPGKTLQGMNKRIGVSVPTISVEKIGDLEGVTYVEF